VVCRDKSTSWQCSWLWWLSISTKPDRKMIEALKIPISGYTWWDWISRNRWYGGYFWATSANGTTYDRRFAPTQSGIGRSWPSECTWWFGWFSVRCIRN
jgi:hypothetical protein